MEIDTCMDADFDPRLSPHAIQPLHSDTALQRALHTHRELAALYAAFTRREPISFRSPSPTPSSRSVSPSPPHRRTIPTTPAAMSSAPFADDVQAPSDAACGLPSLHAAAMAAIPSSARPLARYLSADLPVHHLSDFPDDLFKPAFLHSLALRRAAGATAAALYIASSDTSAISLSRLAAATIPDIPVSRFDARGASRDAALRALRGLRAPGLIIASARVLRTPDTGLSLLHATMADNPFVTTWAVVASETVATTSPALTEDISPLAMLIARRTACAVLIVPAGRQRKLSTTKIQAFVQQRAPAMTQRRNDGHANANGEDDTATWFCDPQRVDILADRLNPLAQDAVLPAQAARGDDSQDEADGEPDAWLELDPTPAMQPSSSPSPPASPSAPARPRSRPRASAVQPEPPAHASEHQPRPRVRLPSSRRPAPSLSPAPSASPPRAAPRPSRRPHRPSAEDTVAPVRTQHNARHPDKPSRRRPSSSSRRAPTAPKPRASAPTRTSATGAPLRQPRAPRALESAVAVDADDGDDGGDREEELWLTPPAHPRPRLGGSRRRASRGDVAGAGRASARPTGPTGGKHGVEVIDLVDEEDDTVAQAAVPPTPRPAAKAPAREEEVILISSDSEDGCAAAARAPPMASVRRRRRPLAAPRPEGPAVHSRPRAGPEAEMQAMSGGGGSSGGRGGSQGGRQGRAGSRVGRERDAAGEVDSHGRTEEGVARRAGRGTDATTVMTSSTTSTLDVPAADPRNSGGSAASLRRRRRRQRQSAERGSKVQGHAGKRVESNNVTSDAKVTAGRATDGGARLSGSAGGSKGLFILPEEFVMGTQTLHRLEELSAEKRRKYRQHVAAAKDLEGRKLYNEALGHMHAALAIYDKDESLIAWYLGLCTRMGALNRNDFSSGRRANGTRSPIHRRRVRRQGALKKSGTSKRTDGMTGGDAVEVDN